ncbi:MAG TPA: hypothetical protein VFJ85_18055 [Acidimicrobiales bacterium]|nr:hypothetical protein [Acidimicrobiales bacterium]
MAAAVVGGAVALWGLAIGLRPMGDNSALTHLATGRYILHHGFPHHDPFAFTAQGLSWTVQSWLAAVGMALAERASFGHGVMLARAVLTTLLAVLAWRLTRPAGTMAGRILAVAPVLVIGSEQWPERPLLLGLVFLALLILAVEEERLPLWAVGVVMWLWVNSHGSFPLGLVYLGVRLVGRRLDHAPPGRLPRIAAAAGIGTLAGAMNPYGPKLLTFPLHLLARHDILARVREWRSPDFTQRPELVIAAALLLAAILAGRRRSWEDSLVALVFGAAALVGQRNLGLVAIVLAPVLARGLQRLGTVRGEQRSGATAVAAAALAAVAVLLLANALERPAYDLGRYPVRQLDWMQAHGLFRGRVATQDFVGNLVALRQGTARKVFVDDRYELYPRPLISDWFALLDGKEGWQHRLDKYGIDAVVWERNKPLAALLELDPAWKVVRRDKNWIVAVRR